MHLAKGGLSWVASSYAITALLLFVSFFSTGFVQMFSLVVFCVLLCVSCLLVVFFRDPERPVGPGVVAVADGRIRDISSVTDAVVGDAVQISTFMNIHNVHVNRMPLDGTITSLTHINGGHLPAFRKESESNERVVLCIDTALGPVKVVQIAGTVARRIVPYVAQGQVVHKGDKIGLIRLGSRVDLYLPRKKIKPLTIRVHDTVHAGEDSLAEICC